ncbi:MAG: hypothetical protein RLZZ04_4602 [Cyanobacteriota bacterium]|jgi:hypothetical protein
MSSIRSTDSKTKQTKVVYAPSPSNSDLFTSIYSIEIYEDQAVEWQWLELPDGSQVVTNYRILNQENEQND